MALVNTVTMSGYVATEPKAYGKDLTVGRLRIRWDRSRKVKDEWTKEANFFSVVVFGDDVNRLLTLKKGDMVMVTGRLQQNQKEDTKQEFVDIVATSFAYVPTDRQVNETQTLDEAKDFLEVS